MYVTLPFAQTQFKRGYYLHSAQRLKATAVLCPQYSGNKRQHWGFDIEIVKLASYGRVTSAEDPSRHSLNLSAQLASRGVALDQ